MSNIPITRFGRTGLKVSRLVLGTMTFGLQTEETVSRQILDKAFDAGINFMDTANRYPSGGDYDTAGRTEEIIGRWLRDKGPRARGDVVITTKAGGIMGRNDWDRGNSRKHLLDAIDASLKRLQTDYVDLYQLHQDDRDTSLEETLHALDTIVRSGRARYVGVSNMLAYRLARAIGLAELHRLAPVVSVQTRYSLLFREIERELLPLAQEEGLAVLTYNPLAGGLLSGKYKAGSAPEKDTRFTLGTASSLYQGRYWNERCFATVEKLQALSQQAGIAMPTLAVAWVMSHPAVTAPLLGASKPSQLDATLAAATCTLDPGLKRELDELTLEYRRGDAPH